MGMGSLEGSLYWPGIEEPDLETMDDWEEIYLPYFYIWSALNHVVPLPSGSVPSIYSRLNLQALNDLTGLYVPNGLPETDQTGWAQTSGVSEAAERLGDAIANRDEDARPIVEALHNEWLCRQGWLVQKGLFRKRWVLEIPADLRDRYAEPSANDWTVLAEEFHRLARAARQLAADGIQFVCVKTEYHDS